MTPPPPPPISGVPAGATADGGSIALPPSLSAEDLARSQDRFRVYNARRRGSRWLVLWLLVGPGILAMLGENDGPSMISYATTGATYGLGFFVPFIVVTFAMSVVCQEMCMRVGAVTHRGYGQLVLERYGRVWGWFAAGDLILTNLVTLVAEFVAIRVGLAYFHIGAAVAALLGVVLVVFTLSGGRYWRWERIVLALAVFNGLFLLAAIASGPSWGSLGRSLATFSPLPGGSFNTVLLLVASTIGATVTPWMIFFQQSASADKGLTPERPAPGPLRHDRRGGDGGAVRDRGAGRRRGAVCPRRLADRGARRRRLPGRARARLRQAGREPVRARADRGRRGRGADDLGQQRLCRRRVHRRAAQPQPDARGAAVFFGANVGAALIAGAIILVPGVPLLAIALNANVLATVLLPVALVFMILLASDRELMGQWANGAVLNRVAIAIVAFISLCGSAYAVDSFLQAIHVL